MTAELTSDALRKACRNQNYPKNVLFHSDQGSQYTADEFVRTASHLDVCLSYSLKAYPFDNAPMEAFNAILKKEEVFITPYADFDSASLWLRVEIPHPRFVSRLSRNADIMSAVSISKVTSFR